MCCRLLNNQRNLTVKWRTPCAPPDCSDGVTQCPPLPATSTVPTSAGTVEFAESFSWDFPVKVDAILSLKDQCDKPIAALDEAIGDATSARGMVEHQRARLVETVVEHLTNVISAAEHALSCFRSLRSALEDYGGAVKPISTEFQAIITDATAAGLAVSQDGTTVTISHPANIPGGLGAFFASLRERCETNQRKFAYAETLFGDDLAGIDPALWESTLLPVFNKFVDTYGFPTGLNASARLPGWADTMRNTLGDTIESVYLQAKGAKYQAPAGIKDASLWKQITERGNLKNWKVPGVDAVKGGSRAIKTADVLRTGGKLAGRACAVLDGVVSAYDSYQSDSYHHPEMGQGEKVARAGLTGALAAGGAYAGASAGAQLGAAIGAFGGPVGILAGGIIGGVVGGLIGSKIGQGIATKINNAAYSAIHGGGQPS